MQLKTIDKNDYLYNRLDVKDYNKWLILIIKKLIFVKD
jgi:hypothetical protein